MRLNKYPILVSMYTLFLLVTEASATSMAKPNIVDSTCILAQVMSITDGDTYKVQVPVYPMPFTFLPLRPRGLDAPELNSRCDSPDLTAEEIKQLRYQEEALAKEVRAYASSTLLGKTLMVCNVELDSFGRLMGEITIVGEEKSLRQMLEDRQYVKPYKRGTDPWCDPEVYE